MPSQLTDPFGTTLPCPKCAGRIPVNLKQIRERASVPCPKCGQSVTLQTDESSVRAIERLNEALARMGARVRKG